MPRFVIIGGGPTGLGAAHRLEELGEKDWLLLERDNVAGGLAGSITDSEGFVWDLGGHVQFSHYDYFDKLMDDLLTPAGWVYHEREAWIWMRGHFIPYPMQNNIWRLPPADRWACIKGLLAVHGKPAGTFRHFGDAIDKCFGQGLAEIFLRPYNFKVWAYPPEELNAVWLGERVAMVNLERVLDNLFHERDDIAWGPNNTFRFPRTGGTGSIWRECARRLPPERVKLGSEVEFIETARKVVMLKNGHVIPYDFLISSMPLDLFIQRSDLKGTLGPAASRLRHSSTHIIGVGIKGQPPGSLRTKCWMYFPESDNPFYRVTVFSNYGPGNVPDNTAYWSLMAEVSESSVKPVDASRVVQDTLQGMLNTHLLDSLDNIVTTWHTRLEHGYPTPGIERDAALAELLPALMDRGVYSRGRFGAWKYEVSNQDHSLMQGVECVNHLVYGSDELTVWHPNVVNGPKPWKARK